jgi:5-methylcytosine-specific restriction endonuclease McrA
MCAACKEKVSKKNMHLDHIKAHAAGGSDRITNLQLLCGHCNSSKGTRTQAQFKKALATKQAKSTTKTASAKKATSKATATKKPAAKKRQTKQRDPFADLLGI